MKHYTDTISKDLAEKLKAAGMPIIFDVWTEEDGIKRMVDIFHGIYKEKKHHPLPSYAEVFDWLMEKGVFIFGFRRFDNWRWAYSSEWRFRIELEDISQESVNGYLVNGSTWHEAAKNFRGCFLGRMNKCRESKGKKPYSADNEIMDICLDAAELSYKEGAEWMFKECGGMTILHDMRKIILAQCREWMKEHSKTEYYSDGMSYCDTPFATQEDMLDTFDFDMNKLWED